LERQSSNADIWKQANPVKFDGPEKRVNTGDTEMSYEEDFFDRDLDGKAYFFVEIHSKFYDRGTRSRESQGYEVV
jgi:hypothetical protein